LTGENNQDSIRVFF